MVGRVRRFDVVLVDLDPTRGSEIQKMRPCLVVSPDEMNAHLRTLIVAPMTTTERRYKSRVAVTFQRKRGQIALDQIHTIDKQRVVRRLGTVSAKSAEAVARTLVEMFAAADSK
ncbi:MAG: type II toxin-antitoxin system PemK/MazF family toxin [Alphaproteobacteria bacterium]